MSDYAHDQTDKMISDLENRIATVYHDAAKDVETTILNYFKNFEKRDEQEKALYESGEISKQEYTQWRVNQMARGDRYYSLQAKLSERYHNANKVAMSYVNDAMPSAYALNRNYAAYQIEQTGNDVDYTLFDENTVRRLIMDDPDLMPNYPEEKAVARGIDLAYGREQITNSILSGILQGSSIKDIADRLQERLEDMNRASAIRTARTAMTEAENAGRQDEFDEAVDMGIQMEKVWVATLDDRTRETHIEADGQVVDEDEPFHVGDDELMYPGDSSGSPEEIYNCRCTMIARVKGVDYSDAERRGEGERFEKWQEEHKEEAAEPQRGFDEIQHVDSYDEVEDALTEEIGFGDIDEDFDYIDEDLAIDVTNELADLENKFGAVHESKDVFLMAQDDEKDPHTIAFVSTPLTNPLDQTLDLTLSHFSDYTGMYYQVEHMVETGWHMPCAESDYTKYTVAHEYGHMVENIYMAQKYEEAGWRASNSHEYVTRGSDGHGDFSWYKDKDFMVKLDVTNEIIDIAEKNNPDFSLEDNLSEYGHSNDAEFFAECFANSQLSTPNELGNAMNEWLEQKGLVK